MNQLSVKLHKLDSDEDSLRSFMHESTLSTEYEISHSVSQEVDELITKFTRWPVKGIAKSIPYLFSVYA